MPRGRHSPTFLNPETHASACGGADSIDPTGEWRSGSVPALGAGGRGFKSPLPDWYRHVDTPSLFIRDGETFVGTPLTSGPWNPKHANGSSALALLCHCLDAVPTLTPMSLTRFTVDLMRPVPVGAPLTVSTQVAREGKKLQIVDLALSADGVECVLATALRLREADLTVLADRSAALPTGSTDSRPAEHITPPERSINLRQLRPEPSGALLAGDILRATRDDGASATWLHMCTDVVAGERITPTARLGYCADFTSLIGVGLVTEGVTMINPDITTHVLRLPVGEWVAITGDTRFDLHTGRGISMAELSDDLGVFAVASASQILEPRPD